MISNYCTIAYKCINFATAKIVVYCIVLYIGLCVSIKNVTKKKNNLTETFHFNMNFITSITSDTIGTFCKMFSNMVTIKRNILFLKNPPPPGNSNLFCGCGGGGGGKGVWVFSGPAQYRYNGPGILESHKDRPKVFLY